MSEIEQNNRYGHHTALPSLVSAYMHIKCTVGRMMANPNDLYSVDELKDVCREAERWAILVLLGRMKTNNVKIGNLCA